MAKVVASVLLALASLASVARATPPRAAGAPPPASGAEVPVTRRGEIVEQVIAVVRGPGTPQPRVITLTRLKEEARIALVSRGAVSAATAPLDGDTLRATLEWLIDQTLLGDEVARLQVFDVTPRQLQLELERFQGRFAGPAEYRAFLTRLDIDEEDLAAVLRRTYRVQQYVQSRITGSGDDAGTHEERALRQVKALVADLRDRSDVRLVGDVEGRAP